MPENPYLKRRNKHSIGKAGRKSEINMAKKLGGKQTPGSGNMEGAKGDIRKGSFLIEAKSSLNDTFKIDLGQLAKITAEANNQGKNPALTVSFVTGDGRSKRYGEWTLIRLADFEEFMRFKESQPE